MNSLPKDLDQGLLQELECPVCMELMKPPINMCENGHSICPNCKPKLPECPTCKKPFLQVRNLALESLSRQAIEQPNAPTVPPRKLSVLHKCPFARISNENCLWAGRVSEMKLHIKKDHNNMKDFHEAKDSFNIVLTGLCPIQHYRKAVSIFEELFYIVWYIKEGIFYCAVLHVGNEEDSSKFTYKFCITIDDNPKKISMTFPAKNVLCKIEDMLEPGECVSLQYATVVKFLNTNNLLTCDFDIFSTDKNSGLQSWASEPELTETNSQTTEISHDRHRRRHRKQRSLKYESTDQNNFRRGSLRCDHGKKYKHCKICKYAMMAHNMQSSLGTALQRTTSIVNSRLQHIAPGLSIPFDNSTQSTSSASNTIPSICYCEPSSLFTANNPETKQTARIYPTAPPLDIELSNAASGSSGINKSIPSEKRVYVESDFVPEKKPIQNSSAETWRCTLCGQNAPKVPNMASHTGWNIEQSGGKWLCKMCGQIRS